MEAPAVVPRLKEKYLTEVAPALVEQLGYTNVNQVPRLSKIVVNMGVGAAAQDVKMLDAAVADLTIVTGQKPLITRAKKSIAGFKIRKGMPIGAKVTLRGDRIACWRPRSRVSATSAASTRTASTAGATTRWASTSS
jgi:large subunit ribosomal protein L5